MDFPDRELTTIKMYDTTVVVRSLSPTIITSRRYATKHCCPTFGEYSAKGAQMALVYLVLYFRLVSHDSCLWFWPYLSFRNKSTVVGLGKHQCLLPDYLIRRSLAFWLFAGVSTDLLIYSIPVPVLPFQLQALGYDNVSSRVGWLLFAFVRAIHLPLLSYNAHALILLMLSRLALLLVCFT
jgi:hypothetical protein